MASGENSLSAFHNVLQELSAWLRASSVEGVVIGGVAVVLLGRPRMTRDVDMLVWLDDEQLPAFLAEGQRRGFSSRFSNPLEFAKKSHIVSVRHALSQITVDIALGALAFELELIQNCLLIQVAGFDVAVPRPEDLILMKAIAQRDQDVLDIQGVIAKQTQLDKRYLRKRAREFALMLDQPEIEKLIDRELRRKRKR